MSSQDAAISIALRMVDQATAPMNRAMAMVERSTSAVEGRMRSLDQAVKSVVGAFAAWQVTSHIQDAVMLAARYETLGVVMGVIGNNAGYTRAEMDTYSEALRKNGIAAVESRQVLTQMAQANIDLSKATDLARIAQDAAVIANINSSDAFKNLVYGIQSAQVDVLRTIGINVSFENSYKNLAAELGRTAASLTENEKAQARVNEVMRAGEGIAGTYEAAMGTAGKQLLSMKRYADDLKKEMGEVFTPALSLMVEQLTNGLKNANKEMIDGKSVAQEWGKSLQLSVVYVEAEVVRLAMLLDKIGGTMTTVVSLMHRMQAAIGVQFSVDVVRKMDEWNKLFEERYQANDKRMQQLADLSIALENEGSAAEKNAAAQAELEKKRIAAGNASRALAAVQNDTASFDKQEKAIVKVDDALENYFETLDKTVKKLEEQQIAALDSFYSLTEEQEMERINELWQERIDRQNEAARVAKDAGQVQQKELQEYEQAFSHMLENLQDYGADFFYDWFSGAGNGWRNLMGNLKDYFLRMLAELAAAAIARPIMISVVGSVAGGLGMSNIASAATSSGALSNLGIVGDLMGAFGGHGGIMGNLSSMAGWEWIQDAAGAVVDFSSDLAGVAESISNFGAWVESIPVVGKMGASGVMSAAFAISDLLSGDTKGAITNGIGAGLSMINPVLGAAWGVGNWIGSTFFGSDEPEPEYKARYQVKSQTHSQHRMLWQNTGTKGEDIGQSATNQINQAIFDLMLQWDKNLLSLADAMGESGKKWQQSIKYAFNLEMNQDINSAADVETLLNRMNESIFDNLAPTLNQGLNIFWADTKAGMAKLPVWNMMSAEWLANINSQVAALPKLSSADTAEQGMEKFNSFIQEVAGIDTWMQGVNTLVDDIRSSLRGETVSEFEKSYLAVEEQFASWGQQLQDLGINLKKFPELAAALNKSLADLTAGAFDSIQDVIDKHELSDQAYKIKSGMPAVQEWYDEQLAMLDFLAGENRLTGGDYATHLADLNKAMAYKIDDLQGSAENAIDQWDEFFRSMQLSDLAPGQSLEGYLAEYQQLKAEGDFSALADYVKSDFLPFVQAYTGGSVDYNSVYSSVMSDLQGMATGTSAVSSVSIDAASAAAIGQAVAAGMLSITDSTGKEIVINLNLDSRQLDSIIAGMIKGGGLTFDAIQAVT